MGEVLHPGAAACGNHVAILLSTFNGARFLPDQLASIARQTHPAWRLLWRDDGSTDDSIGLVQAFAPGHCQQLAGQDRLGATASFMALLRAAAPDETVAFADQDDVWLPEKLARGLAALTPFADRPAIYCARQMLVDSQLQELGLSAPVRPLAFPAALTQNVATGCTLMLNPAAARLVAESKAPGGTLHDWWSYLVVTARGGALVVDDTPTVLYRQHAANLVGAPRSRRRRAWAALRRGPGVFMNVLRQHVTALRSQPQLLSDENAAILAVIDVGLNDGPWRRFKALRTTGLVRQTRFETFLFRAWFMIG